MLFGFSPGPSAAAPLFPTSYTYEAGPATYLDTMNGGTELTDGIKGDPYIADSTINPTDSTVVRTGDPYVGSQLQLVVDFDFGNAVVIDQVTLYMTQNTIASVRYPGAIRTAFSADGAIFSNEQEITLSNSGGSPAAQDLVADLSGVATMRTGQYVRITILSATAWTFTGEIEFSGAKLVPEPAGYLLFLVAGFVCAGLRLLRPRS
jgi:hypothetical protein